MSQDQLQSPGSGFQLQWGKAFLSTQRSVYSGCSLSGFSSEMRAKFTFLQAGGEEMLKWIAVKAARQVQSGGAGPLFTA